MRGRADGPGTGGDGPDDRVLPGRVGGHSFAELRIVAKEAVEAGAEVILRAGGPRPGSGELKGAGDYVTQVDRESEDRIRSFLARRTPEIPVVGEEAGGAPGEAYWAVDPLDGTTNFLLGLPVVGVSVALISGGVPVAGAVGAPFLDLRFSAARGLGCRSGDDPVSVSVRPPDRAVVATGFPFRDKRLLPRYLSAMEAVLAGAEDLRRAGAASLDLAWVAAGVFDGFFELGLSVWDVAAGALLVQEAGGVVTDWEGGPNFLSGDILAGSPQTHVMLVEAVSRR